MDSYAIYQARRSRQVTAARNRELLLQDDVNKFREIARLAKTETKNLKFALFGDSGVPYRTVRKIVAIDDAVVGAIPPVSVRFARRGFVNDDWRNSSLYDCYIVLSKDAVFTQGQADAIFYELVDVLKSATKGE